MTITREQLEKKLGEVVSLYDDGGNETAEFQERYHSDPVGFITGPLGMTLTDAQRDIAEAVGGPDSSQLVHVQSGHAVGKDAIAAALCVWHAVCKPDSLVLTSAVAERQVREVIFEEIRKRWNSLRGRVQGTLRVQGLTVVGGGRVIGFTASDLSGATGFHAAGGILYLLSEAQGLGENPYSAALASLMDDKTDRLLCVGNPHTPDNGPFHRASMAGSGYRVFELSCLDHPNVTTGEVVIPGAVTKSFCDLIAGQYGGTSSPEYLSRVLGRFPSDTMHGLLSRVSMEASVHGWETRKRLHPDEMQLVAGLDIGRDRDKTVLSWRLGETLLGIEEWDPLGDLVLTQEVVEAKLWDLGFRPRNAGCEANGRIVVDAGGLGVGILDPMKRKGWPVVKYQGGSGAFRSEQFHNLRAEAMWQFKEGIESGAFLILPGHPDLIEEATALTWSITPASKKLMGSKDLLRSKIGRSTDVLDSVVMCYWRKRGRSTATVGGGVVTL